MSEASEYGEKPPAKILDDIRWAAFNLNMGCARWIRVLGALPPDIEAVARATAKFLDDMEARQ